MREKGLPSVLRDIEHATVALLDRWEVTITRAPAEKQSLAANQLQRMSSLVARDRPDAEQVSSVREQLCLDHTCGSCNSSEV